MSPLRAFGLKCFVVVLATQVSSLPAIADGVGTGGFIIIDSKPLSLEVRNKPRVHRYYAAPKVYHHKPKPKVYHRKSKPKPLYSKPVKRHRGTARGFPKALSSPYRIPQSYGIQHRGYRYGISQRRY